MHYRLQDQDHGLPHDPLKALIAPRPIGWISSVSETGVPNLAPYSFFNLLAVDPAIVGFSSANKKDSQTNIEATGKFVCNFPSAQFIDGLNQSSAFYDKAVNEFDAANIQMGKSKLFGLPIVANAPAYLECEYMRTIPLNENGDIAWSLILGEIKAVFIDDAFINKGIVDTQAMQPLTRMGYLDYGVLGNIITKPRPAK